MATPKRLPWALGAGLALALGLGMAAGSHGQDDVTCYCRLALASGADPLTGGLEIQDWKDLHVYNKSPYEMVEYQVRDCTNRCMAMAQQDPAFSDPAGLCRQVARPFDGRRQAVARVDENPPVRAFYVPLKCCPGTAGPVSCPAGWTFDANGPGPLQCRRNAGHLVAEPLPPNGTPIGAWGVVLGADVWQWGPPAPAQAGAGAPTEFRPCS